MKPEDSFPNPPSQDLAIQIQRLADDALDDASRTRLLRELDLEEPERWRDLALALLEARLLTGALQRNAIAVPALVSWPRRALALAAAVALGAFLGFAAFPRSTKDTVAVNSPPVSAPGSPAKSQPRQRLRVEGLAPVSLDMPVLNSGADGLPPSEALHAAIDPARRMQQELAARGVDASLSTSYVSADLEDGRHLLIPVSRVTTPSSPK